MTGYPYWRTKKGGELLGPTAIYCKDNELDLIKKHIENVMGYLPKDLVIAWMPGWSRNYNSEYEKFKKESKNTRDKNCDALMEVLKDVNGIDKVYPQGIDPVVGETIKAHIGHRCIEISDKLYRIDNEEELSELRKIVDKRINERIQRRKKSKNIKGRTTPIGKYKHITENSIEKADFAVYLDVDQEINEAEAHCVGTVKFYKRSPRQVMFDIDKRKIMTRNGKTEIEADNSDQVIDALINCLAGKKNE
jgi:hypothetical protein